MSGNASRWFQAAAFGAALAVLAGCGGGSGKSDGTAVDPSQPTVAFVSNNAFEFWTIARKGTEKAATEFKVNVEFQMPSQGTAPEQRQIIEDLLTKGVKGIAVSPLDAANQGEFFDEVAAKIPLVAQDSDLPPGSKRVCYLGTNNYEAGKSAGKLLKEALPDGGKVVIYVGKLDVQNAVERRQGVVDELAGQKDVKGDYPLQLGKYTLIDTMTDGGDSSVCKGLVEDTLTKNPDLAGMVGLWEYNPPAMLSAVKNMGKVGKVAVVGFDENEETLQGIKDGSVYGTIVQQPFEFGYQSIRILAGLARDDRSVLPEGGVLFVPHREIVKGNVEEFHTELKRLKSGS